MKPLPYSDWIREKLVDALTGTTNERDDLRGALARLKAECDALFTLACDSIIHDSEGWRCRSCGMELDTGGTHKGDCCASRILDLNHALYFAEEALKRAKPHCCASSHEPPDTACKSFLAGQNGRCAYCDHEAKCHPGPGATCWIGSGEPAKP